MENYHDIKGYVSNSSLNILEESPRKFKQFVYDKLPEESTSYYTFGTATHMYLLEPDRFKTDVAIFDYAIPKSAKQKQFCEDFIESRDKKMTVKNSYSSAYAKNYSIPITKSEVWVEKAKQLHKDLKPYIKYLLTSPNKLVISTKTFQKIKDIVESIKGHKTASKLLSKPSIIDDGIESYNELQILWEYQGIKCKSMLDRVLVDKENKIITIVDLKTTANLATFSESFIKYHYDRQLVFYGMALAYKAEELFNILNIEEYKIENIILAIDKVTTEIKTFKILEQKSMQVLPEIISLLDLAKWHIDNNKFEYSKEYYEGDGFETL